MHKCKTIWRNGFDDERYVGSISYITTAQGNIQHNITGPLWGESTGDRWIPLTKASDAELWCLLWSVPEQTVEQTIETLGFEKPSRSLWRHRNEIQWDHCHFRMIIFMCWFKVHNIVFLRVQLTIMNRNWYLFDGTSFRTHKLCVCWYALNELLFPIMLM